MSSNLRFGRSGGINRCTVLVVTSDDSHATKLIVNLLEGNEKSYGNLFQINGCYSVLAASHSEILGHSDYVVLVANPCRHNWNIEVEENLANLDVLYTIGKFCLVIDTSDVGQADAEAFTYVNTLRKKYSMHILNGQFNRSEILQDLSSRLLTLISRVSCNPLGIPLVTEYFNL